MTNVQVEELLPELPEELTDTPGRVRTPAPTGNLLITLALDPAQAERVIFSAEHGMLWLASQYTEIELDGTRVQTRGRIYGNDSVTAVAP